MTIEEIAQYYADLLIIQYYQKPKAAGTVKAIVKPLLMDLLPTTVRDSFSLTTGTQAVGDQLDVLGKYIGVVRRGYGFDGDVITLTDADFVQLLLFSIISNSSGSSFSEIKNLLWQTFGNKVQVFDFQNMRMSYYIDSDVGSEELVQMLVYLNLLPRPMGVQLAEIVYAPITNDFFGFQGYDQSNNSKPFNTYAVYNLEAPWLSYSFIL